MVHSRRLTARSTSSSEVAKRSKPIDRLDRTPERSGTSTLKTRVYLTVGNRPGYRCNRPRPVTVPAGWVQNFLNLNSEK
jgi:hypothetical protein